MNPGALLNSVPAPTKQAAAGNYLDFTSTGANSNNWAQQYLPDLMEKEAEVFGNRTVSGFLAQVGAEEAMASDQVVWSEQGRLHLSYSATITAAASTLVTMGSADHGIRKGDTVVISSAALTLKAYVSAVGIDGVTEDPAVADTTGITVLPYTAENLSGFSNGDTVNVFVYGSEYAKGSAGREDVIAPKFTSFTNKPIILKDKYEVSGSDASAIGWVEVSGEEGQNGYLWYLKASGDTKSRFADYCEMSLIEAEKKTSASNAPVEGTEGLFAAVTSRGNISTQVADMIDFDAILKEFDKQGAIEENMMFLNRVQSLDIDDMLSGMSTTSAGGGAAYGVFDNDADMALNLGFSGFRRGSYDFYKTDWKYLNDVATRGGVLDHEQGTVSDGKGGILGMIVPAGVSTVYDQSLGKNLKRPFLHVRYRASGLESRKMKTWTTGSVGAVTSDIDAMEMHFLSERCLVVQGANNFMLLKGNL